MASYYNEKLSAQRLRRVYETAPPRVKQYLSAEMEYVLESIEEDNLVLDLGCGYGRALSFIAAKAGLAIGLDTSLESLRMALADQTEFSKSAYVCANAVVLPFRDDFFDVVACVQNGISAFHLDQKELVCECLRVTKHEGTVLISSYSEKSWESRLEWFKLQAKLRLIGEIDEEKTRNGVIACKDGFQATTVSPKQFLELATGSNASISIEEIDSSSVFCRLVKN
jgi:ubiquinone/menaquinone biosynthesis C-methylase UbiE